MEESAVNFHKFSTTFSVKAVSMPKNKQMSAAVTQ